MKRCDKYPPGTEEDARNLPAQTTVCGLHPLVWGLIVVFLLAGVGMYSEMIGFYDIDDFGEILSEESDHDDSEDDDRDEVDDSEDASIFLNPDDDELENNEPESNGTEGKAVDESKD